jgi:hypothetical protein
MIIVKLRLLNTDSALYDPTKKTKRAGRPRGLKINKKKYVDLSEKQILYLNSIYTNRVKPSEYDLDHIRYNLTRDDMVSYPNQIINNKQIYAWIRNKRFRERHTR